MTLSILLNFWTSPVFSGIIAIGVIYLVLILGGKLVKDNISQSFGEVLIGLGYIFMILAIIGIIKILSN